MTPQVSVVIVTFNSSSVIHACLQSLERCSMHGRIEVIVVDNVSTDGTVDLVRREFPNVVLVRPDRNLGYAGGNNLGASRSRGEYLLLLNPDTVVTSEAISLLAEQLNGDPAVWVVGPCILDGSNNVAHAYGDLPTLWWALAEVGFGKRLGLRTSRVVARMGCPGDRDVEFITGASLMTTRDAWNRLGGLDEDYFLYFEDADYSARIRRAGGRIRLVSQARVVHLEGASLGDAEMTRSLRSLQGLILYFAKNSSRIAAQTIRLALLLEYSIYFLVSYLPGRRFDGVRMARGNHRSVIRVVSARGILRKAPRTI